MANEKRIVIVAGGEFGNWALDYLHTGDVLAGADRGALFLVRNGLRPDIAIGDFDSVTEAEFAEIRMKSLRIVRCDPVMKDLTDTEMAFEWAAGQNPSSILLLGVTGSHDVISLLPFGREATGITLRGFRYPLVQATLSAGRSLGVSNIIEQDTAAITLERGDLLVIRSRD